MPVPPLGDQQAMSIDPPGDATTETSGKGSGRTIRGSVTAGQGLSATNPGEIAWAKPT